MADNVNIPAQGTGDTTPVIAADDVGGVKHQRVKVEFGTDGVATDVSAAAPLPVVQTGTPGLPTGAATEATVLAGNVLEGAVTETAPGTDTAPSGLNGRLQRIAQRLTSLIALLPASLGQKTMANGLAVTVASDQSALPITDNSGSLTVDAPVGTPVFARLSDGTAALTTTGSRLAVDGSGVTQPVSGTVTANIGTSGSLALDATLTGGTQKSKLVDTGGTNVASVSGAGALKVDGSAVTQPVSGTVTANAGTGPFPVSDNAGSLTVDAPVGTPVASRLSDGAAFLGSGHGTAAAALRVELPTDGTGVVGLAAGAATIGALTANQSVNQTQVAGTAVDTNSGTKSAGTQRVVLATDQPALSTPMPVADGGGSLTVDNGGTFAVQPTQPSASTAAVTAFTATSSTTIFSSNASAKLRTFANDSDKDLYLYMRAAAVSVTVYHAKVPANGGWFETDYTGEVRGIMSASIVSGQVNCGEFT